MTKHTSPDANPAAQSPSSPISPTSMTIPSLTARDGTRLMGGLTWEIASGPETPVVRPDAPLVLRLPERRARLALTETDGSEAFPAFGVRRLPGNGPGDRFAVERAEPRTKPAFGSLLLAMGDALTRTRPGVKGFRAFMAELHDADGDASGDPVLWLALADLGAPDGDEADTPATIIPRPEPEQLFSDPDTALAALHKHLATTEIAGIGVSWLPDENSLRGRILQGLAHIAPTLPLEEVDLNTLSGDLPCFLPPRRVPARVLGGLGGGAALLLAGVLVGVPMIESWFETPPPPPPEMVSVRIEEGAFARACTTALDAWWPRRVGWQLDNAGCAMAGHLPATPDLPRMEIPARLTQPIVIWQHLVPETGRNPVLAAGTAEELIATWPHEARLDPDGLTLWKTAALPLIPVGDAETREQTPPLDLAGIHDRLAALWADTPDAVTRSGTAGEGGDQFTIRISRAPATVFERAGRVPGIAPVRLIQPGQTAGRGAAARSGTLVLAPDISRDVPAMLFGDSTTGGPVP